MTGKNVENDTGGMHFLRQSISAGCFNCVQTIRQNCPKDIDHLTIAIRLTVQFTLHPS